MKLPSEIVVESFLPTFRALLASELSDRGFTQNEIADRLGVSQPAVSKYVAGEVEIEDAYVEDDRVHDTVERVAEGFEDATLDGYEALAEVLGLVRALEDRGPICEVHEREFPALRGTGCDLCVRGGDSSLLVENETLGDVRRAVRRLKNIPGVAEHVPNVGTNVAQALPDARDETDVAAVPGRLYTMNGRVHVPANPEFGASKNVAVVVLSAQAVEPSKSAALNLATSDALLETARDEGMTTVEFDADREERRETLDEAFAEAGGVPDIAYHRGSFGVEPVAYVIAEDAPSAVEKVERLVRSS
ncbi:MAG: thiamine-phosphate synthase family protein [Halobacteriales archaeon]|nr:thiamine-phosphate synthase family protein [Halobacteriales archaeon]